MTGKRMGIMSAIFAVVFMTTPALAAGSLHVTRMTERSEVPGLTFECAYPRLYGMGNESRQEELNVRLRELAATAKAEAELKAKKSHSVPVSGKFGYEVKRDSDGILSLKLVSSLSAGKSRCETTGITVDTVSGAEYTLSDLFRSDADYVSMLSGEVSRQIADRGLSGKLLKPFRAIDSDESYYLKSDELVIILGGGYFSSDSYPEEFPVKLKSLEGSLKPSMRLGTLK
jgi:hypothetical protein